MRQCSPAEIICQASTDEKMTVAVTGGTGFVGAALVSRLVAEGHTVKVLTRATSRVSPSAGVEVYTPAKWANAIKGCTGVVNLAGEPISTRWSSNVKDEILTSRVACTERVTDAINGCSPEEKPDVFVSASALGYYGTSETATYDEASPAGKDYLAKVCIDWEREASKVQDTRLVILRLGIVLDNGGGALAKMMPIFKLGLGGPLGDGNQWFSWIHRDDIVSLIMAALQDPAMKGAYNATAPNPVRMKALCNSLGEAVSRPAWFPVPAQALQVVLGEGATVVLEGQKVLPNAALDSGFEFKYAKIEDALKAITLG